MNKSHVAILFVHGLTAHASSTDNQNDYIKRKITSFLKDSLKSKDSLEISMCALNYATIHSKRQELSWNKHQFSPFNPITPVRMIPHRVLNMGLSFWNSDDVKEKTFRKFTSCINNLSDLVYSKMSAEEKEQTDVKKNVSFVIVGFSMGASLALEYLTEYREVFGGSGCNSHPEFSFQALELINNFSLLISIGCAISWHFPIRPTLKHTTFPWSNIYYETDFLASPLKDQGKEFSHINDFSFGICPNLFKGVSRQLNTVSGVFSFVFFIFLALLKFSRTFFLRVSPLSHLFYFWDDEIIMKICEEILAAVGREGNQQKLREGLSSRSESELELFEPVCLEKIQDYKPSFPISHRFAFVYVHGMSTKKEISYEIDSLTQTINEELKDLCTSKAISYVIYSITYFHYIVKDEHIRRKSITFKDSMLQFFMLKPILKKLKEQAQLRFPVAMSYWTDKRIHENINDSFEKQLKKLCQELNSASSIPCHVILISYTTGSLVTAYSLGNIQEKLKCDDAYDILSKMSDLTKGKIMLSGFFTLGSPLSWFGDFSLKPLPKWKEHTIGWTNIYYKLDLFASSLKQFDELFRKHVNHEVCLSHYNNGIKNVALKNEKFSKIIEKFSTSFLGKISFHEMFASWNGIYLSDSGVYKCISEFIEKTIN